jgi:hypothetical protein
LWDLIQVKAHGGGVGVCKIHRFAAPMEVEKMTTTTSPQEPEWPLTPLVFWVLVCAGYAVVAGGLVYAIMVH